MKKSVIVAIVAGAITIASIWPAPDHPIGAYDVDLSRSGRTELPAQAVLCCQSRLRIYLEVPINVARNISVEKLLNAAQLECEIKTSGTSGKKDDVVSQKIPLEKEGSWFGAWVTRRVLIGRYRDGDVRGLSLSVEKGCPELTGEKQRLILEKTPCITSSLFSLIWRLPIFCMAGLTTLIALWIAIFSKNKPIETPKIVQES
jgi:hypothetical protein